MPTGEVPATGARHDVRRHLPRDGRIESQQIYYDQLALAVKLGLVPSPA